ncbi:unnamed protein product [Bursaphelenchus okinawaensis]|uniref:BPTI/Kunitz inhibitor domain-containing protein n=1 Tax=Bursaphelenchus okinawaensis TaxID=465554 RepID=A0A811L8U7_9BILA|nr:unnamed protein product [Bursaphelenchus okinawaensis]CAG9120151.1 unnamed protein product [Bursaphelenchus okinawaensis]
MFVFVVLSLLTATVTPETLYNIVTGIRKGSQEPGLIITALEANASVDTMIDTSMNDMTLSDQCHQKVEVGYGDMKMDRFYYDKNDDTCVPFVYSGMGGNFNNFVDENSCRITCKLNYDKINKCNNHPVSSCNKKLQPSSANIYYYDSKSDECNHTVMSSCDDETQFFGSKHECDRECGLSIPCHQRKRADEVEHQNMLYKVLHKLKWFYTEYRLSHFLPFTVLVTYTLIGAAMFRHFELQPDEIRRKNYRESTEYAFNQIIKRMTEIQCGKGNGTSTFQRQIQTRETKEALFWLIDYLNITEVIEERCDTSPWTWMGSLFYAGQLYTTIGYGLPAAQSTGGRVATMFYIMIGIPVFLIILKDVAEVAGQCATDE